VRQLREHVGPLGYEVIPVPVTGCLHLKTGACSIGKGRVLVNADWVETSAFEGVELIPVSADEPWSANGVLVGESMVVPAGAPKTSAMLRDLGLEVHEVGLSEMQKAEGSATCLCVLLNAD
jgi:dimethylargininase